MIDPPGFRFGVLLTARVRFFEELIEVFLAIGRPPASMRVAARVVPAVVVLVAGHTRSGLCVCCGLLLEGDDSLQLGELGFILRWHLYNGKFKFCPLPRTAVLASLHAKSVEAGGSRRTPTHCRIRAG